VKEPVGYVPQTLLVFSSLISLLADEIEEEFEFLPRLHRFLTVRSNIVPPMIATGVGPEGRKVVHLQPPAGSKIDPDANIDPTLISTPHRSHQESPSWPIEVNS
jgi:hypothetical protein